MKKTPSAETGKTKRSSGARIKVIGMGGGGGNAVSRMSANFLRGVDFIAVNTDAQDLEASHVRHKVHIGKNLTRGLGTGMNPEVGRQAAEENRSDIIDAVGDADLVFISAGLGGGTGTGASPVVAEVARQAGALTVAVVTKPFAFEGSQRARIAHEGLQKLKNNVDALIVIPNDRIFTVINKDTSIAKAFEAIDDILRHSVEGIVELIASPGIINVDFADVRAIIQDAGTAIIGLGMASGQDRAVQAVQQAINSPLLEVSAEGAKGMLYGIAGGRDLKMSEINDAARIIAEAADPGAKIIFGAYRDKKLRPGQVKVTLVATGLNGQRVANSLFDPSLATFGGDTFLKKQLSKPTSANDDEDGKNGKGIFGDTMSDLALRARDAKLPEAKEIEKAEKKDEKPLRGSVKQENKDEKATQGESVWDIPTFLRRKKK